MNTQLEHVPIPIDLEAYFQRIGYSGDRSPTGQTLQAIHYQHTQTIAFENLSALLKQPVPLDLAALQQKLIQQKRGGYCFEQNLLLRSVLLALGFQVTGLAARVMWNLPEGTVMPRTHMLLRIDIEAQSYIADVGFGGQTLTAPLQLIPDWEQTTSHEPFRLLKEEATFVLQTLIGQTWKSLYRFDLQPQQLADYEVSNWYISTYPQSPFVNFLIAARPDTDRRYALRNNLFTVHYLNGRSERQILSSSTALCNVLEDKFHIRLETIANLEQALQRVIQAV